VKALYELLTRDLVEEVRGAAAQTVLEQTPVDEAEVAETPVPLPLVAFLALLAILSIATSFKNPLNALRPLGVEQGKKIFGAGAIARPGNRRGASTLERLLI